MFPVQGVDAVENAVSDIDYFEYRIGILVTEKLSILSIGDSLKIGDHSINRVSL